MFFEILIYFKIADAAIVFWWFFSSSLMLKIQTSTQNASYFHCMLNKTIRTDNDYDCSFTGPSPPANSTAWLQFDSVHVCVRVKPMNNLQILGYNNIVIIYSFGHDNRAVGPPLRTR